MIYSQVLLIEVKNKKYIDITSLIQRVISKSRLINGICLINIESEVQSVKIAIIKKRADSLAEIRHTTENTNQIYLNNKEIIPINNKKLMLSSNKRLIIIDNKHHSRIKVMITIYGDYQRKNHPMYLVGLGQDSHRIKKIIRGKVEKPLVLGGLIIDRSIRVYANSDGDIILHSLFNACSQAIGLRSIGYYDNFLKSKNISSTKYITFILNKIYKKGYIVNNISIMLEAAIPCLEPFCYLIKKNIAQLMEIPIKNIGIAFTTGEGLTSFGKGKGIQSLTSVLLVQK